MSRVVRNRHIVALSLVLRECREAVDAARCQQLEQRRRSSLRAKRLDGGELARGRRAVDPRVEAPAAARPLLARELLPKL
eukprot:6184907-Pleurochrysis_carterae.AAC.5